LTQSWVGKTIGDRYKMEALLGQGGMSAVYRASDPNLRRMVAIKLIHTHLSSDPNFIGRFKEEAAAVARLRHPNIVQVHDFNIDSETYYMVMEYLVGETLQARLKRLNAAQRHMPVSEAVRLCTQVCDAAGYAHNHELVHRDIKPANIMLNVNGQAILMDFGIVKIVGGDYHTATGATIGTAMYMSPEQIRSERIDDRADIYSLGVTLYEMISGHPPYQADSALTLMMMVLNDPLPDLRDIREGVPVALLAVVEKALAKEPSERFQTMAEMAAALQQVQEQLEITPPATTVVDEGDIETAETPAPLLQGMPTVMDTAPEAVEGAAPPDRRPEFDSTEVELQRQAGKISAVTSANKLAAEADSTLPRTAAPKPRAAAKLGSRRIILAAVGFLLLLIVVTTGYLYLNARKPPDLLLAPISRPGQTVNAQTAKIVVNLGKWDTGSYVEKLTFSPDGALLGTVNNRDWVRFTQYRFYSGLWQVSTGGLQNYLLGHTQWVFDAAFSPDGQLFATASDDATVLLWQAMDGSLVRKIDGSIGGFTSVDFSPNNLLLAAGSWDGIVGLWQVSNSQLLRTFRRWRIIPSCCGE